MIDLSIIIPVYNAENHIERCLLSIVETYKKTNTISIETIIVNDGSKDNSANIIETFSNTYPILNIKLVHQDNQGVYKARNHALSLISGRYLWMLDADDYIDITSLPTLETHILENVYEIVHFGYYQNGKNTDFQQRFVIKNVSKTILSGLDFLNQNDGRLYLWTNIYQVSFLKQNKLTFLNEATSLADVLFNITSFSEARKVLLIQKALYYYCDNGASISRNHSQENLLILSKNTNLVHNGLQNILSGLDPNSKKHKTIASKLNHSVLGYFYSLYAQKYPIDHIKEKLKLYKELNLYPINTNQLTSKKALFFAFIANKPFIYLILCKLNSSRK